MAMHFAFVSIPAHGHVNPTLPLVAELVGRGHRVTYFTAADFEPRIRAAGAAFPRLRRELAGVHAWPGARAAGTGTTDATHHE